MTHYRENVRLLEPMQWRSPTEETEPRWVGWLWALAVVMCGVLWACVLWHLVRMVGR